METTVALWWAWMGSMLWQVGILVALVAGIDFAIRRWAWPQELAKIEGLQMRLEIRAGSFLAGRRFIDEVVQISRQVPPPGTYEPPVGYRKIAHFERLDL